MCAPRGGGNETSMLNEQLADSNATKETLVRVIKIMTELGDMSKRSQPAHGCNLQHRLPQLTRSQLMLPVYRSFRKLSRASLFLLLAMLLCGCSGSSSGDDLILVAEFEGGQLYKAGPVSVLKLHGTHHEMGRQYGMLLKDDLNAAFNLLIATGSPSFSYDRMKQIADNVYGRIPQQHQDIIVGMSETSGLGLEKQTILNALEWIPKIDAFVPHCSGIGVWGDYTKDGSLIFGRNNDDDLDTYGNFGPYVGVAVFNPTDSGMPVALVNYAGVVYAATGMNSAGIFMELNSGTQQPPYYYVNRSLLLSTLFSFLEAYSTQDQINTAFQGVSADISSIVNVAAPTIAYSFEIPLTGVKRRSPDDNGLLAATNHFVDPSWGIPPPDPDSANAWTALRRNNLLAFAAAHKGSLDVDKIKEVIATPIANGGVLDPGTIYQVVAVPKDLTIWLRTPNHYDWQKIDLNKVFIF